MNLEPEFSYIALLKAPVDIGAGPLGTRQYVELAGGTFKGKRLNGKLLSGGGDWLLFGADGCGRTDVRVDFMTDDGAAIYGQAAGIIQHPEKLLDAWAKGSETKFTDHYFRVSVKLETGDPRYAWVNQSIFVAEARALSPSGPAIEYSIYRVL